MKQVIDTKQQVDTVQLEDLESTKYDCYGLLRYGRKFVLRGGPGGWQFKEVEGRDTLEPTLHFMDAVRSAIPQGTVYQFANNYEQAQWVVGK